LPEDLHALCAHYRDQERSYQQSPLITANRFNKEKNFRHSANCNHNNQPDWQNIHKISGFPAGEN